MANVRNIVTNSNDNVLIGTDTDSGYKLDVSGTGRFTSNLLAQKVQVGTAATINDATGVGNTLQFANYSAGAFVTGSADSYVYKTSSVFGGLAAQTLIFQTRSDVAGGGFAFVAGTTPAAVATITGSGNVGIGTTDPETTLHVVGLLQLRSSTEGGPHVYRDNDNAPDIRLYSTAGTFASPTAKSAEGLLGQIHWAGYDGTSYTTGANIYGVVDGSVSTGVMPTRIEFRTNANPRLIIKYNGNVLIGTTTDAGYKLRVVGSSYTTGDVVVAKTTTANANFGGPVLSLGDSTSEVGMCGGIAFAENLTSSLANVTMGIYYDGKANKMHFTASSDAQATAGENLVAATKHMTITRDTGLVGIGTTSPAYTLDVSGTARTTTGTYLGTSSGNVIVGGTTSDLIGGFKFIAIGNTAIQYAASTGTYLRIEPGAADTQVALKADARSGAYPPMAFHTSDTERMRITSAGNVGIGTTAPGAKLALGNIANQNGVLNYTLAVTGESSLFQSYADISVSGFPRVLDIVAGSGDTGGTAAGSIIRFLTSSGAGASATSEKVRITSAGNVGIGTTSPQVELHVKGNNGWGEVRVEGQTFASGHGASLEFYSEGTALADVYASTSKDLILRTNGTTERMRITAGGGYEYSATDGIINFTAIDSSGGTPSDYGSFVFNLKRGVDGDQYPNVLVLKEGNVGIGTTAPTEKLQVAGSIGIHPGQKFGWIYNPGTDNGMYNYIQTAASGGLADSALEISGSRWTNGNVAGVIFTHQSGGQIMTIMTGGNVGIGNTSPITKLHINSPVTIPNSRYLNFYAGEINQSNFGSSLTVSYTDSTATSQPKQIGVILHNDSNTDNTFSPALVFGNKSTSSNFSAANSMIAGRRLGIQGDTNWHKGELWFWTATGDSIGGADRGIPDGYPVMVMDSLRRVGIGTTSPASKLHIDNAPGSDVISISDAAGSVRLSLGQESSYTGNYIDSRNIDFKIKSYLAGGSGGNIFFQTGTGTATTKVTINVDGNVGIGTTAPAEKLEVVGNIQTTVSGGDAIVWAKNGTVQSYLVANTTGGSYGLVGTSTNHDFLLRTNNTEKMRISSGGAVGIGNTSPTEYGSGYANLWLGSSGKVGYLSVSNGSVNLELNADGNGVVRTRSNHPLIFGTNETERMRITSDGNVGIGTTSPSDYSLLHVNLPNNKSARFGSWEVYTYTVNNAWLGENVYFDGSNFKYRNNGYANLLYSDAAGGFQIRMTNGTGTAGDTISTSTNLSIKPNGNVQIGTTTDAGYKLDVNGECIVRDDLRILNTYALILNGTDANWRIGRNTITDTGWLTGNTMQMVVYGSSSGQGFQVVNSNGTALFEIDGVQGYTRLTYSLGVGVDPSGTQGRIDASNDIVAYSTSDSRLKENITPIANALDKVKSLTGVEFDWKEETKDVHGYDGHDVGVIAQEVQAVLPEAIRTNDTGYLSVRYEKLIGLLIEAVKEQQNQIDELKAKLDDLTR